MPGAIMAKDPHIPENVPPDDGQLLDTYAVGYGRPPVHTRFKPGHTKRGGRRKGQRNSRTALVGILTERIPVREGNRTRTLSKRDALYLRIVNDALAGNDKAQAKVIALMQLHGLTGEPQETTNDGPFTADDAGVIADFLQRQSTQPTDTIKETPEIGETKLPNKQSKAVKS
jgi:hypothetical protein